MMIRRHFLKHIFLLHTTFILGFSASAQIMNEFDQVKPDLRLPKEIENKLETAILRQFSSCSGFFVSKHGHFITNAHCNWLFTMYKCHRDILGSRICEQKEVPKASDSAMVSNFRGEISGRLTPIFSGQRYFASYPRAYPKSQDEQAELLKLQQANQDYQIGQIDLSVLPIDKRPSCFKANFEPVQSNTLAYIASLNATYRIQSIDDYGSFPFMATDKPTLSIGPVLNIKSLPIILEQVFDYKNNNDWTLMLSPSLLWAVIPGHKGMSGSPTLSKTGDLIGVFGESVFYPTGSGGTQPGLLGGIIPVTKIKTDLQAAGFHSEQINEIFDCSQ